MNDKEKVAWTINWLKEIKHVIEFDGCYSDIEAIEAVITEILGEEKN